MSQIMIKFGGSSDVTDLTSDVVTFSICVLPSDVISDTWAEHLIKKSENQSRPTRPNDESVKLNEFVSTAAHSDILTLLTKRQMKGVYS